MQSCVWSQRWSHKEPSITQITLIKIKCVRLCVCVCLCARKCYCNGMVFPSGPIYGLMMIVMNSLIVDLVRPNVFASVFRARFSTRLPHRWDLSHSRASTELSVRKRSHKIIQYVMYTWDVFGWSASDSLMTFVVVGSSTSMCSECAYQYFNSSQTLRLLFYFFLIRLYVYTSVYGMLMMSE